MSTEPAAAQTAAACAEVATLRLELATARQVAALHLEAQVLRVRIAALRERGGALSPDPVGEFWAWATRGFLSVRDVGFGLPLAFALLIEIVSAFGPAVIAAVAMAGRDASLPQPAQARLRMPQPAALETVGSVLEWLANRTEPTSSSAAISTNALHVDYEDWCAAQRLRAASLSSFVNELDRVRLLPELSDKIRKFGNRYYGLRLVIRAIAGPVNASATSTDG